jgi:hypothetical protein
MHDKVLTADNMMKRNWTCNSICSLCFCLHETTPHIITQCNYTEAVWNLVPPHLGLPSYGDMGERPYGICIEEG